ncbi:hypothetical protein GCM10009603_45090 [Nocardiopsis exhalans]
MDHLWRHSLFGRSRSGRRRETGNSAQNGTDEENGTDTQDSTGQGTHGTGTDGGGEVT